MRCPRGGGSRVEVHVHAVPRIWVLFSKAHGTLGWELAAVRRPVPKSLGSDNIRDFGPTGAFGLVEPCCSFWASSSRWLVLSVTFTKDFAFHHVYLSHHGKAFS